MQLVEARRVSWSWFNQAVCALRFFYRVTLDRGDIVPDIPYPRGQKRLPTVLSAEEVSRLLEAVESQKHRAVLSTIHAAGLRLSEALALQVTDIDWPFPGRRAGQPPHATAVQRGCAKARIDGTGLYLMPGLIDSHVHLRDPSELLSYLAHGVTTVVQLSGPSGNIPNVADLRGRVGRSEILGPTIYMSGRILDGDPPIFPGVSTIVRTPDEAREALIAQLSAGVDVIKVYNNLRTHELEAVTSVAHEHGLTVWGHIPRIDGRATALQRALAAGLDVIAHGEEVFFTMLYRDVEDQLDRELVPTVDQELMTEAVRLIQQNGVAVMPNLSFVAMTRAQLDDAQRLWTDPEAQFLHPTILNMWKTQNPTSRPDLKRFDLRERGKQVVVRQLTLALNDAGVPLFLGTDASAPGMFPGKSALIELTELVAAGLTPFQALATGTSNPGRFLTQHLHGNPPVGTVTVGSRADLLLLNADPLTDISHVARIAGVVVRGKWRTRAQIDSMRVARGAGSSR